MASNSSGIIFRITTFGESHGKAMGVVIDGCPAGLEIHENDINTALALRATGKSLYTTPRQEPDEAEIVSGVYENKTTGAPICILIPNQDADPSKYEAIKELLRPGHANYTYLQKYGVFDHRGGGRASARETVCRVAAGAVAKKLLAHSGIEVVAYIQQIGDIEAFVSTKDPHHLRKMTHDDAIFCPDEKAADEMKQLILAAKDKGDSVGGIVEFRVFGLPPGFGDPVYEKLEACLAKALMGLPASKGFEIGRGFQAVLEKGSTNNDLFKRVEGEVHTSTNHAGGILGGISTGMPIVGRVAFKPTSSIMLPQETLTTQGESVTLQLPQGSRHDPCVAIRAVAVVEAMVALVLADALLLDRCARL